MAPIDERAGQRLQLRGQLLVEAIDARRVRIRALGQVGLEAEAVLGREPEVHAAPARAGCAASARRRPAATRRARSPSPSACRAGGWSFGRPTSGRSERSLRRRSCGAPPARARGPPAASRAPAPPLVKSAVGMLIADFLQPRDVGRARRPSAMSSPALREQQAADGAEHAQHRRFGHQLPDHVAARRADGEPDRDLAAARQRAQQRHDRDVDARDEQHRRPRPPSAARAAAACGRTDCCAQRLGADAPPRVGRIRARRVLLQLPRDALQIEARRCRRSSPGARRPIATR